MLETISNFVVLWTPSPLHCLLRLVSSSRDSDCDLQCAQRSSLNVFYMLPFVFSQWPAVETVLELYRAHSEKQDEQKLQNTNIDLIQLSTQV